MGEQAIDRAAMVAELRAKREALNTGIEAARREVKALSAAIVAIELETAEEIALRKIRTRRGLHVKAEPAAVKLKPQSTGG